ncbi:related to NUT2 - subunit of the RNA polymerase II mediator complex [Ustilago trichophora]|uniref:Mediator of RNA polymerase II transcription subunit 10 n=1 Tax=Ustilago trichophora TaxID=86804 RepID=A0A5C3DYB0_9BASI|nr:related to NUT2 - subunit of the RNA polymerase II mediator complex [Ustilago trichophora]
MSSAGARRPRQITPTSPSPSPEPQSGTANGNTNSSTSYAQPPTTSHSHPPAAQNLPSASAPEPTDPNESVRLNLETRVRSVVDLLYQLAVCSADVQEGSQHLVANKVNECIKALAALDATKDELHRAHMMVPQDVLEMLDTGKNPDIHTRNFVNRLASENQYSYGQHRAVESYKNRLDEALDRAFPELGQGQRGQTGTEQ